MPSLSDKAWVWGYVINGKLPGKVPFVGESSCSLETGAEYLGIPNTICLDGPVPECLDRLKGCRQVICGLPHRAYVESAREVSRLSKKYPNITGALIDDFLEFHCPSKDITPDQLRAVYDALKSENPALKLYLVRYTWQDQAELTPYLPYFDVINLWVWVANTYDWQVRIDLEVELIPRRTSKPILLGLFIHDYGFTGKAVDMDVLELQFKKAVQHTRNGLIEGFVVLQPGWFDHEDHRPQVQWVRQYLQWAFGTATCRSGPDAGS